MFKKYILVVMYNNHKITYLDNGIIHTLKQNSILIDASTIDPEVGNSGDFVKLTKTAREVAKKVSSKQAMMVDAPVSGGWPSPLLIIYNHRSSWCRKGNPYIYGWRRNQGFQYKYVFK